MRQDIMMRSDKSEEKQFSFVTHGLKRSIYPSNPRGYFDEGNIIDHFFNSAGYRDIEHSLSKPENTYRILGLGDSYLFGEGVKFEDGCLTRLQRLLEKETPIGKKIEVINTGVSGFNTVNERDLLIHRGLAYDPDMIILHFILNDVEPDLFKEGLKLEFYTNYVSIYMEPDWLSKYSYFWGWARQRYLRTVSAKRYVKKCIDDYLKDKSGWEECASALKDINNVCKNRGIKLLVVVFPFFYELHTNYPFQVIHNHLRNFCEATGIPILDLLPSYKKFNGPELWVHPIDQHPNEIAHETAAKAIFNYLMGEGSFLLKDHVTVGKSES